MNAEKRSHQKRSQQPNVATRLDPQLLELLRQHALEQDRSLAQVVRLAIAHYLAPKEGSQS